MFRVLLDGLRIDHDCDLAEGAPDYGAYRLLQNCLAGAPMGWVGGESEAKAKCEGAGAGGVYKTG